MTDHETHSQHEVAVEPASTPTQRRLTLLLSGVSFFVGYVLTAGPAVFLVRTFDVPFIRRIVELLYAPLVLIVKLKVPLLSDLIQAWVELFR